MALFADNITLAYINLLKVLISKLQGVVASMNLCNIAIYVQGFQTSRGIQTLEK